MTAKRIDKEKSPVSITRSDLTHHWQERLNGNNLKEIRMTYKDADYFKRKDPHLDPDTTIYDFIVKESDAGEGHLNWGHITVHPGRVKDQYFCTKGNYHQDEHAEEYLLCMQGYGLIMYMNRENDCWCEEVEEGTLHKVPEGVARRLINLSDEPLMFSTCLPTDAGYDFDSIDEQPFPCHVYEDDGEPSIEVDLVHDEKENAADFDFDAIFGLG